MLKQESLAFFCTNWLNHLWITKPCKILHYSSEKQTVYDYTLYQGIKYHTLLYLIYGIYASLAYKKCNVMIEWNETSQLKSPLHGQQVKWKFWVFKKENIWNFPHQFGIWFGLVTDVFRTRGLLLILSTYNFA